MTAMTGEQNRRLDSVVVCDDGEDSKECQKTFDRCCGEFLILSMVSGALVLAPHLLSIVRVALCSLAYLGFFHG